MSTYVPPTGYPLVQQGAQAYNKAVVFNDGLLATVNDATGTPAYYIRGMDFRTSNVGGETVQACRVVRIADSMELLDCGSVDQAQAFIASLNAGGGGEGFVFGEGIFGVTPF